METLKANSKWRLDGKKALVTGGTKGIGLATAQELLELGAKVIITARDHDEVASRVASFNAKDFPVYGIAGDVSEKDDRLRLLDFVTEIWGALDILVNNAGTNIRKPTMEYSDEEVEKVFNTNLASAFGLCRNFYPMLRASRNGCIVNVSSVA